MVMSIPRRPRDYREGPTESRIQDVEELRVYLEKYVPKCIKPGEDRDAAMFYAGQVELATKLLALI